MIRSMTKRIVSVLMITFFGFIGGVVAFNVLQHTTARAATADPSPEIPYSRFLQAAEHSEVSSVTICDHAITGRRTDGKTFATLMPDDPGLVIRLVGWGVEVTATREQEMPALLRVFLAWLPMLLLLLVCWLSLGRLARRIERSVARLTDAITERRDASNP
jgi:ATP-dependent Zn protease